MNSKIKKKQFMFSSVVNTKELPAYVRQYIKNEQILTIYKTERDYGAFTDKKIVLFDNKEKTKQIYSIPYKSISNSLITFNENKAQLSFILNSNYLIPLNFINMDGKDKRRLRILYICIDSFINEQEPIKEDIDNLINNNIKL